MCRLEGGAGSLRLLFVRGRGVDEGCFVHTLRMAAAEKAVAELGAGVIAGTASTVAGFPFDTVKVRLQAERGVYGGAWDCCKHILKHDGVRPNLHPPQ